MNTTHTPGPWYVTHNSEGRRVISAQYAQGPSYTRICTMNQPESNNEVDASLIAAAPELLAALKIAIAYIYGSKAKSGVQISSVKADLDICMSAIAKATGGAS